MMRWNKNLELLSGYSAAEVAAMRILDFVADPHKQRAAEAMRKAFEQGSEDVEVDCRAKDGRVVPFYITARRACVRGISCLIGTGFDLTQRRQAEQRLADERNLLRTLIDNIPDAVYIKDRESRFVLCNREVLRRKALRSLEEIVGRSDSDFYPPELAQSVYAREQAVMQTGRPLVNHERYVIDPTSGSATWNLTTKVPLRNSAGEIIGLVGIGRDITERKRMENALCESERKYRDLYEGSRDGTAETDLAGKILHCNLIFLDMLGYSGTEMARLTHREITPARWHAEEARILQEQVCVRGYSDVYEKEYIRKDGSVFPVEVRAYLSRDNVGRPVGMWALVRDITERKKAEAQVRQHLAELTRAWHANALGEMASGLAHELNQPLCAILNYSGGCLRLTRKPQFSVEALQDSIEQIAAQAQRAADIIKRIRSLIARHEPHEGGLDLHGVLNEAVRMLESEALQHGVTVVCRFEPELPTVRGDSVEIEQVALNLMRNAIEAMSDGDGTCRTLTISSSRPDDRHVEVAVTDTGRGIAPELSEKIFESFFTTKDQGLGIGLALSRRIVEAHGGRLWAESQAGAGATFRFTLPIEGAAHGEGESGSLHCGRR
jgi:PAS domain S-box-containing protein